MSQKPRKRLNRGRRSVVSFIPSWISGKKKTMFKVYLPSTTSNEYQEFKKTYKKKLY